MVTGFTLLVCLGCVGLLEWWGWCVGRTVVVRVEDGAEDGKEPEFDFKKFLAEEKEEDLTVV